MPNKENILNINNRYDFRKWLEDNSESAKECYIILKRGEPKDDKIFYYLDAVEEALCFGWIDSTLSNVNGIIMQRFAPRTSKSHWTQLNKERCKRLIALGLMTDMGYKVMPNLLFETDKDVLIDIEKAGVLEIFQSFPNLYQIIRMDNLASYKHNSPMEYSKKLNHFIEETKKKKMYGQWNDYGRL